MRELPQFDRDGFLKNGIRREEMSRARIAASANIVGRMSLVYIMVYTTTRCDMGVIGKLFMNGRSQAVRIPAQFRFEGREVEFGPNPIPAR